MHPGERIKQRRKELSLSAIAVAEHAGINDESYRDVEAYESEFKDVLDLARARRICNFLRLDLFDILALDSEVPRELLEAPGDRRGLGRGEFIRACREAKGLSAEELADRVGYEAVVIELAETDPSTLESRCLALLMDLAKELNVPLTTLVIPEPQIA